jgi:hypothetical protein
MGVRSGAQDVEAKNVPVISSKMPEGAVALLVKPGDLASNWVRRRSAEAPGWHVDADGAAIPTNEAKHDITSRQEFGDCFLHAEFQCPVGKGGNSGVSFQGRYEVQVYGNFGQPANKTNCAALYNQTPARVNASRPQGEWQSFDIVFRAPRFDAEGRVTEPARATVFHNGVLVHNNAPFKGPTGIQYDEFKGEAKTGPVILQGDHDFVKFRNVWILPM